MTVTGKGVVEVLKNIDIDKLNKWVLSRVLEMKVVQHVPSINIKHLITFTHWKITSQQWKMTLSHGR